MANKTSVLIIINIKVNISGKKLFLKILGDHNGNLTTLYKKRFLTINVIGIMGKQ